MPCTCASQGSLLRVRPRMRHTRRCAVSVMRRFLHGCHGVTGGLRSGGDWVHEARTFDDVGVQPIQFPLLHLRFDGLCCLRRRLNGHAPALVGVQVSNRLVRQALNAAVICQTSFAAQQTGRPQMLVTVRPCLQVTTPAHLATPVCRATIGTGCSSVDGTKSFVQQVRAVLQL